MRLKLKHFYLLLPLAIAACSTSKEARQKKNTINGEWVLKTITTEGINGKFSAKVFNETDYGCFIGSTWNFVGNNSTGTYTIDGMSKGCEALKRNIRWSIYEPKDAAQQFQFKRLDDKKNSMDDGDGFRLDISGISADKLQLKSNITYEGHAAALIYDFVKK